MHRILWEIATHGHVSMDSHPYINSIYRYDSFKYTGQIKQVKAINLSLVFTRTCIPRRRLPVKAHHWPQHPDTGLNYISSIVNSIVLRAKYISSPFNYVQLYLENISENTGLVLPADAWHLLLVINTSQALWHLLANRDDIVTAIVLKSNTSQESRTPVTTHYITSAPLMSHCSLSGRLY